MPSVQVPPAGTEGWRKLQNQRKAFWAKDGNDKLTLHLKAVEFHCHDGSYCPTSARPAMVRLCTVFIEPMRARFGAAHVLSGYRHRAYNASIGGARHSQHIYEDGFESVASDLRFQKGNPKLWASYAKELRSKANRGNGGVGQYDRSGFVHVDNRPYAADWKG